MDSKERILLEKIKNHHNRLLSPEELFNTLAAGDHATAHNLIVKRYIDEVHVEKIGKSYTAYRINEKGLSVFYPLLKKLWYLFKGDVRTIVVTVVISIITTLVTLLIKPML